MPTTKPKNPYDIGGGVIGQPSAAKPNTPGLIAPGLPTAAANSWLPTSTTNTQADWFKLYRDTMNGVGAGAGNQALQQNPVSGTRRTGGGGGGGGAVAAPTISQDQLNWYASLLKGAGPQQATATSLDLPDWQDVNITPFDNSMWSGLRGALGEAYANDSAAGKGAYDAYENYLNTNYRNPYDQASYATSQNVPGSTAAGMQRLLSSQGMNPQANSETYRQGQNADQAFGNLLALAGANEDRLQANRLSALQADRGTTQRALDMARLQGMTGIGLQEGQAKQAWQQRADDRAMVNAQQRYQGSSQEALANWQRANEVGDLNVGNTNSYRNTILSQLAQLLPSLYGTGLSLPDLAALGLA